MLDVFAPFFAPLNKDLFLNFKYILLCCFNVYFIRGLVLYHKEFQRFKHQIFPRRRIDRF